MRGGDAGAGDQHPGVANFTVPVNRLLTAAMPRAAARAPITELGQTPLIGGTFGPQ
ncbi:hypothetical protein L838_2778 [Mycobacterium avium MAV_120709_2344]|nr:hypothetical protein L840_4996 [Mycobacterium sp. MAC_011194_8550]ETZ53008.1 hypothetical protein L838_2778 [Mycobacterium avium MAV_120709_2344]ETZ65200.1 hypothetical protein L841_3712 [Mycobacterium sp. MAC_080597_8934]